MIESVDKVKLFYNQGLHFLQCAERCMGEMDENGDVLIIGGKNQILITPTIVNAAFSCELFLKSILLLHGINYRKYLKHGKGHNLKNLYDLLPCKYYKTFLERGIKNFEYDLSIHANDFERWRYYMERDDYSESDVRFIVVLMQNLKTLSHRIIDNWEQNKCCDQCLNQVRQDM